MGKVQRTSRQLRPIFKRSVELMAAGPMHP
ncbi:hypothetical protein CCACVL1_07584 [Corchorus capsularis]|uniref:Uncharacterized protein n=1 Tax=Corchorus capsularis TaxID=210143 RepID=A0A1R3J516_COCAP|nr:hypothetical protein CCACVL1_07584 [Corchorus capsularis]